MSQTDLFRLGRYLVVWWSWKPWLWALQLRQHPGGGPWEIHLGPISIHDMED